MNQISHRHARSSKIQTPHNNPLPPSLPPHLSPPPPLLKAIPPPPISRLPLEKGTDGAQIALVAQKIGALVAAGPEFDGVGERVHRLAVAADEGAAEVDVRQRVLFRLEVGDLSDVVAVAEGLALGGREGEGGGERRGGSRAAGTDRPDCV